ncbi:MAG: STAS domain-containing protein [Anaerolineae bacterium]
MASKLQITISEQQGRVPVTVFHLNGDIDANSFELLEAQARQSYQAGARNLLLDLTKVGYISSAGLSTLHVIFTMLRGNTEQESDEAMKKGLRNGAFKSPHLKLLNPSSLVLETLGMMGFDMFLEIHHNLKEALASF